MHIRTLALLPFLTALTLHAQYGSFDAGTVKAAKALKMVVVLDAGDSPYNRTIIESVKANWKFSSEPEFVSVSELAMQPISPEHTYLLKTQKSDPVKFDGTFLTLVKGWKPKKGEVLAQTDNAFTGIPAAQELAFIQIDTRAINERGLAGLLSVYTKHLQNYLSLVEGGKITDKTTADRTYMARNRHVRETDLWLAQDHLDRSLPDAAKVKEFYAGQAQVMALSQLAAALEKQDKGVTITDVVMTGDHKNKHCFKRVFNVGTGELMYLRDDASIFGKKEGFLDEDLKTLDRAR